MPKIETIYNGKPLMLGQKIPGTSLTFVRPILRRRGEFRCACGRQVPIDISQIETYGRKTCGCRQYIRNLTMEKNRRIHK